MARVFKPKRNPDPQSLVHLFSLPLRSDPLQLRIQRIHPSLNIRRRFRRQQIVERLKERLRLRSVRPQHLYSRMSRTRLANVAGKTNLVTFECDADGKNEIFKGCDASVGVGWG